MAMSLDTSISFGDIVGSCGIIVAVIVGFISTILSRKANRIAVDGILLSRKSLEFARLTAERERIEWTPAAVAKVFNNRSNGTVCITNVSRAGFTVYGIIFVTDSEIVAHRGDIRTANCQNLPQFLPSGASIRLGIPERTLQKIPVDVSPGVILELPARQSLVCKVC